MNTTRDNIIETTKNLLELQGYHATGLNEIIRESGCPKGSLYYYFPGGKDELVAEAILSVGRVVQGRIRQQLARWDDPAKAIYYLILTIGVNVQHTRYQSGGPITAVAMETAATNEKLRNACEQVFKMWELVVAEKLVRHGFVNEAARALATTVIASIEGATLLSRAYQNTQPFLQAAQSMQRLVEVTLEKYNKGINARVVGDEANVEPSMVDLEAYLVQLELMEKMKMQRSQQHKEE